MSRLQMEPVNPKAAVITWYRVKDLPQGEAYIEMNPVRWRYMGILLDEAGRQGWTPLGRAHDP